MRYTTIPAVIASLYVVLGILFGIIFFIISPKIIDGVHGFFQRLEKRLTEMPALDNFIRRDRHYDRSVICVPFKPDCTNHQHPVLPEIITILLFFICGYYGGYIGVTVVRSSWKARFRARTG
jgi:uncharacterized protein YacL